MSSVSSIILFALGAYAYAHVDDQALDKMINRAAVNRELTRLLDGTVVAKGEESDFDLSKRIEENPSYRREGPLRRGPGSAMNDGKPTNPIKAYKNGIMSRERVWGGFNEAAEIAKKVGADFDPNSFFRAATPRLIDPELGLGEKGYFGNKGKFYETDAVYKGKTNQKLAPPNPAMADNPNEAKFDGKANAIPFVKPNPFVQRGNPQRPTLPLIRGPTARAAFRSPFLAQTFADTTSIPALALIGLFVGCGLVLAFHRLRSPSTM